MGEKVSPVKRLTDAMARVMAATARPSAAVSEQTIRVGRSSQHLIYDTVPVTTSDGIPGVAFHNAHHRNTQSRDRRIARRTRKRRFRRWR